MIVEDLDDLDPAPPLGHSLVRGGVGNSNALLHLGPGKPKGVALSHKGLLERWARGRYHRIGRDDEAVVGLPIAHIMGFAALLGLGCGGIPVYFLPRFRPTDVLDALEERQSSLFIGVPAMYRMLWEAGAAERDLRRCGCGSRAPTPCRPTWPRSSALGSSVHLPVVGSVGDALFVEGYGMVETGGARPTKLSAPVIGESLIPLPGYKFRVVDELGHEVGAGARASSG